MSGPSTLRICLAAMAPALTEAASARLKLKDPAPSRNDSSVIKVEEACGDRDRLAALKRTSGTSGCFDALGGRRGSAGDRSSHLSTDEAKQKSTATITVSDKLSLPSKESIKLSPSLHLHDSRGQLNPLQLKKSIQSFIEVSEDFQVDFVEPKQFIGNFKIMNQPHLAADNDKQLNETESSNTKLKSRFFDNYDSLSEGRTFEGSNKRSVTSLMVNGNFGKNKTEDRSGCDEKGDAPQNCAVGRLANKTLEHISPKDNLNDVLNNKISTRTMGMCVNDEKSKHSLDTEGSSKTLSIMESAHSQKLNEDMRKDCVKKQAYLERKVDTLLRRLKRMKGKVVESHTKEQLRQFVNFQHTNLQMVAKTIKNEAPGPKELKEHFLSNEEVKNMSTAQLVKLVRGYQSNKMITFHDNNASKNVVSTSAAIMDPSMRSQSQKASERLEGRVQAVRAELDSDATASSSGGESGDEEGIPAPASAEDVVLPALLKRAEWKWAVDRAAVVSRWTWLQAQVSDLEYRIRQQSQVHRQLRNSKGGVVLGDPPTTSDILRGLQGIQSRTGVEGKVESSNAGTEVSPCNISAVLSNIDKQASRLTQSLGNCLSPASSTLGSPMGSKISSPRVNGVSDSPISSSSTADMATAENSPLAIDLCNNKNAIEIEALPLPAADASCQASRCRPLRSYRKRKILRTIGLYKTNSKASRLSDVRCRCYPPGNPCPMCGGRYNNTVTMDTDTMSFNERVALLDPSFHPVLSFPQDVHLPIHCEGLIKSGLWQNKPSPRRSRGPEYRRQKVITLVTDPARKNGNNRQNGRNNASVINFSAKIKNKYESKTKGKKPGPRGPKLKANSNKVKRKAAKIAREALKKQEQDEDEEFEAFLLEQDITSRDGLSASASQTSLKDMRDGHMPGQRKRKVDNCFDINNIVIPHSMAASTRVEQIQYKEIVTPKWREVPGETTDTLDSSLSKKLEKTNGVSLTLDQHSITARTEEVEDLSDERYLSRHSKYEQEERKRFRNFLQYPPVRRNRARSELGFMGGEGGGRPHLETNEASPLKLQPVEEDGREALASEDKPVERSRPSTPVLSRSFPLFHQAAAEEASESLHQHSTRRRTMSFSRRERSGSGYEELHASLVDINYAEPWPRRIFPLSDEEYQQMKDEAPPSCEPVHQRVPRRLAEPSGKVYVGGNADNGEDSRTGGMDSRVPSPQPSNESMSSLGDDPNDPEWMGSDLARRSKHRRMEDDSNDPEWSGSDLPKKGKNRR